MITLFFTLAALSFVGMFIFTDAVVIFATGFLLLTFAGANAYRKKQKEIEKARRDIAETIGRGIDMRNSTVRKAMKEMEDEFDDVLDLGMDLAVMEALAPEEIGEYSDEEARRPIEKTFTPEPPAETENVTTRNVSGSDYDSSDSGYHSD